jgi:hypothetical protein
MSDDPDLRRVDAGGGGGRSGLLVVAVAVAIAVAIWKPWAATPTAFPSSETAVSLPTPSATPSATPSPTPVPSPSATPRDWATIGDAPSCLGVRTWVAVTDVVSGGTISRTWSRVDRIVAADPADPSIPRIPVVGEAVVRLGFCAPLEATAPSASVLAPIPSPSAGGMPLAWRAWRLPDAPPAPGSSARPQPIRPVPVGAGEGDPNGMLFLPPPSAADGAGAWAPGIYVFQVTPQAGAAGAIWFAAEMLGPWRGPAASGRP